jgi:hypothetical protein
MCFFTIETARVSQPVKLPMQQASRVLKIIKRKATGHSLRRFILREYPVAFIKMLFLKIDSGA